MRTAVLVACCVASLVIGAFDTVYTDSSGARCASFVLGAHEVDLCSSTPGSPGSQSSH